MDTDLPFTDDLQAYTTEQDITCFFTGHRNIGKSHLPALTRLLKANILYLYHVNHVRHFWAGGALGFDTLAATVVFDLRRELNDIRLCLELPYRSQPDSWDENDRRIHSYLYDRADEIHYAVDRLPKEDYDTARKYLLYRDRLLIARGSYCIAYFKGTRGGTAYTVSHAIEEGKTIINLFDEIKKENEGTIPV